MNRKIVLSIAALVAVAGPGVAVASSVDDEGKVVSTGVQARPAAEDSVNPASLLPSVKPDKRVEQVTRSVMAQFEGAEMIKIAGSQDDDVYYSKASDYEAMVRASVAENFGVPFDEATKIVPVVDATGKRVGYFAAGAGFMPAEVVEAPGFVLCDYVDSRTMTADGTLVETC